MRSRSPATDLIDNYRPGSTTLLRGALHGHLDPAARDEAWEVCSLDPRSSHSLAIESLMLRDLEAQGDKYEPSPLETLLIADDIARDRLLTAIWVGHRRSRNGIESTIWWFQREMAERTGLPWVFVMAAGRELRARLVTEAVSHG